MYNCYCETCEGITLHVTETYINKLNETVEVIECEECENRHYTKK